MPKKRYIIFLSALVLLGVATFFLVARKEGKPTPASDSVPPSVSEPVALPTSAPSALSPILTSTPLPVAAPSPAPQPPAQSVVGYTDSGFSPSTLTVPKGTTVTFVNKSSKNVWPASAIHPVHKAYPTTGGCIGSTFDACRMLAPGEEWPFIFDIAGSWKYHNHISPGQTGTIVVQ